MNDAPRPSQLLAGRHVALAGGARALVHMGAPGALVSRADTALRPCRKNRPAHLSLNRVQAAKGSTVEQGRFRADLSRPLRRDAFQGRVSKALGDQGTGAGRHLFSKNKQVPL